jgi:hypothetical protein
VSVPFPSFASPTMSVQSLSAGAVASAVRQIVNAPNFRSANSHLSAAEVDAIVTRQWPLKPVFTPYAITHHGYSQSQFPPAMVHVNVTQLMERAFQFVTTGRST